MKLNKDKQKLSLLQDKASKNLIKIYDAEAERHFNNGEWLVTRDLFDTAKYYNSEYHSPVEMLGESDFPPFSIARDSRFKSDLDIQVSINYDHVGTRYSIRKFIIWNINEKNNNISVCGAGYCGGSDVDYRPAAPPL